MKRITIAALIVTAILLMGSCAAAQAETQPERNEQVSIFTYVHDLAEPMEPIGVITQMVVDMQPTDNSQGQQEADEEPVWEEYEYEADWDYYEDYSASYSGDGFMQAGIREGVDSNTETWYSSNQAYHYRTPEWSVDDEGYYKTDDGYYVVASNDYPEGSIITTSKGEAMVLDDGTESGNVDFYVAW